jgi:hypothetical protein
MVLGLPAGAGRGLHAPQPRVSVVHERSAAGTTAPSSSVGAPVTGGPAPARLGPVNAETLLIR